MASDKKSRCKANGCDSPQLTCSPLGSLPHCRHHFNSYMKAEKNEEKKCGWWRGCNNTGLKLGLLHLSFCRGHISYALLVTGITTSKKRECHSIKLVLSKEFSRISSLDDRCQFVHRENAEGYVVGQQCAARSVQSPDNPYCENHADIVAQCESVVLQIKKALTTYASALVKPPPKRVIIDCSREEYCRQVFERLTKHRFPSTRPDWMKRPTTGKPLELDGYCEKLKLAFEHDGAQHYTYPNVFHKTKEEYNQQLERDTLKEGYCKMNGVYLIRVRADLPLDDIEAFIQKRIDEYQESVTGEL